MTHAACSDDEGASITVGDGDVFAAEMGGMFTVMKIRDTLPAGYDTDPGWYVHPAGTLAHKV